MRSLTSSRMAGCLLEIMIFNVEVRIQVSMSLLTDMSIRANSIRAWESFFMLLTLTNVLNYLKVQKVDITKVHLAVLLTLFVLTIDLADQEIWSCKG